MRHDKAIRMGTITDLEKERSDHNLHDKETRLEALVELGKANERARQAALRSWAVKTLTSWSEEIVSNCGPYITLDDIHHFLLEEPMFLRLFGRYDIRRTEAGDWIMTDTKTQKTEVVHTVTVGRFSDFVYDCEKAEQAGAEREAAEQASYKY